MNLNPFATRWLWEETTKPALAGVLGASILIFSVFLIMGSMFGIAYLVDEYSNWMLLLYLPWIILLPLMGKPLKLLGL